MVMPFGSSLDVHTPLLEFDLNNKQHDYKALYLSTAMAW